MSIITLSHEAFGDGRAVAERVALLAVIEIRFVKATLGAATM